MRVYTNWGWAHRQRVSTTCLTRGKKTSHTVFLCSWRRRGSNLGSLDLEFDALPTEPPRLPACASQPCQWLNPWSAPHSGWHKQTASFCTIHPPTTNRCDNTSHRLMITVYTTGEARQQLVVDNVTKKQGGQAIWTFAKWRSRKKKAYRCSKFNVCCLLSCRNNSILNSSLCRPIIWPCLNVKAIETRMSIYAMYRSTVIPSLNEIA